MTTDISITEYAIPAHLRNLLVIACCNVPSQHQEVAHALKEAISIIDAHVRVTKRYTIFIGTSPFKYHDGEGGIVFHLPKELTCCVVDDYIYLDLLRLAPYHYSVKVAMVLEELVHALMNVTDEIFVKEIVCHLFPSVYLTKKGHYWVDGYPEVDLHDEHPELSDILQEET